VGASDGSLPARPRKRRVRLSSEPRTAASRSCACAIVSGAKGTSAIETRAARPPPLRNNVASANVSTANDKSRRRDRAIKICSSTRHASRTPRERLANASRTPRDIRQFYIREFVPFGNSFCEIVVESLPAVAGRRRGRLWKYIHRWK